MTPRELNPASSSLTNSQASESAEVTGVCSDGVKCGFAGVYCDDCPNRRKDSTPAHSKYHREIKPGVWVDCYDVIKAWNVNNPALQHLLKKAMAPGQRGHKDLMTDLDDIIASAKRAKELEQ